MLHPHLTKVTPQPHEILLDITSGQGPWVHLKHLLSTDILYYLLNITPPPQHECYTTPTRMLHHPNTNVTPPPHESYTTPTRMLHHPNTNVTPPQHDILLDITSGQGPRVHLKHLLSTDILIILSLLGIHAHNQ